jgi:hypothetical protein
MRKGMIYTVSVLLLLGVVLFFMLQVSDIFDSKQKNTVSRARILTMEHFVRDFERYYASTLLEAAAMQSLVALSKSPGFSGADLVDLMKDGSSPAASINSISSTDENFRQAKATISFALDSSSFQYTLAGVEQPSFDTVALTFLVDYSFTSDGSTWIRDDLPVRTVLSLRGLTHPVYGEVIDSTWVVDSASPCLLSTLTTEPVTCSSGGIMPII